MAKEILPIIMAFAEGKTIQIKNGTGSWTDLFSSDFTNVPSSYRIKPEQEYRPFKTIDEVEACFDKIIRHKYETKSAKISFVVFELGSIYIGSSRISADKLLSDWTFIDGTPCGVKV
jgi:hypothetical protein